MEYIDGIEYHDKFISDNALDVLDALSYLQLVGSYDIRNRIIFNYGDNCGNSEAVEKYFMKIDSEREMEMGLGLGFDYHKKYRVNTDDITEDIVHLLLKIDKNIFDLVIGEFNVEEKKKFWGFKYPIYSKCYYWDERGYGAFNFNKRKNRDENFTQVMCDVAIWNDFVRTRKHRGLNLEDIFKIAVVRFLEKRYAFCMKEIISSECGYNKVWFME